jgi:hypothetical protein
MFPTQFPGSPTEETWLKQPQPDTHEINQLRPILVPNFAWHLVVLLSPVAWLPLTAYASTLKGQLEISAYTKNTELTPTSSFSPRLSRISISQWPSCQHQKGKKTDNTQRLETRKPWTKKNREQERKTLKLPCYFRRLLIHRLLCTAKCNSSNLSS